MEKSIFEKASNLKPDLRAVIEDALGCALADDERVTIMAQPPYPPRDEPSDQEKLESVARLKALYARFDERNTVPPEEAEEIILEALRHRKPGYRERE
jgi:hypothetical protein